MPNILECAPGFTVGADPEFFLYDVNKGELIAAEDYLRGSKEEPFKLNKGAVQVDGMAGEINIDPASSYEDFNNNLLTVLKQVRKMLPSHVEIRYGSPTAHFSKKVWEKASEECKMLGCSPDYNAWTGTTNPPPNVAPGSRTRFAGGHIHIGWTEDQPLSDATHILNARELVQQLDYYLGAWSLIYDGDKERRQQYGKAGACRIKPYGVEYRVLSNFWLGESTYRREVWNRVQSAIKTMRSSFYPQLYGEISYTFNDMLIKSINEGTRDPQLESQFMIPIKAY